MQLQISRSVSGLANPTITGDSGGQRLMLPIDCLPLRSEHLSLGSSKAHLIMSADLTSRQELDALTWTREDFFISSDKSLLSLADINSVFDSDYIYWTTSLPEDVLQQVIDGSFCFGLYHNIKTPSTDGHAERKQVGFARLVTDNTTFAYITDLYVLPEYQGTGLGGWLLDCIDEHLNAKPYLRWAMLRTSQEKSKDAYKKRLGMHVIESGTGTAGPVMMGKKGKGSRA